VWATSATLLILQHTLIELLKKEQESALMVKCGEEVPACSMLSYSYCPSGQMEENDKIPTDLLSRQLESGDPQVSQGKRDQLMLSV
jgi:hypothetical protein